MNAEHKALVELLKTYPDFYLNGAAWIMTTTPSPICVKSAAAIESLSERVERAEAETIERCAKIAETLCIKVGDGPTVHADYMWIADAIRELSNKKTP